MQPRIPERFLSDRKPLPLRVKRLTDSPYAKLERGLPGDVGYDLLLLENVTLEPGVPQKLGHGLAIQPADGYYTLILPRSSTLSRSQDSVSFAETVSTGNEVSYRKATKKDVKDFPILAPANSNWLKAGAIIINNLTPVYVAPGVIDPTYRGEFMTSALNLGKTPLTLKAGQSISQLIVCRKYETDVEYVDDLSKTVRANGGFGSTGK